MLKYMIKRDCFNELAMLEEWFKIKISRVLIICYLIKTVRILWPEY